MDEEQAMTAAAQAAQASAAMCKSLSLGDAKHEMALMNISSLLILNETLKKAVKPDYAMIICSCVDSDIDFAAEALAVVRHGVGDAASTYKQRLLREAKIIRDTGLTAGGCE